MNSYHFDLGNSTVGPIGYCARIKAPTKKRALELLRAALPETEEISPYNDGEGVEYISVYFNDAAVTIKDIDDWEKVKNG